VTEGFERAALDLRKSYSPYPMQRKFHASSSRYRFLGGAAGPGKTTAMLMENLITVNEFNVDDAKQVQTLFLRRTQPMLENTLVTRFREKIDRSLYKKFTEKPFEVLWLNGAITRFGSCQYEEDIFAWQGQWKDVYYDEVCEFTWKQWNGIAPWNRCPVSTDARRLGAGNPVGVGTTWVRPVFVEHRPCDEMDDNQRKQYRPSDYAYFPCTYLDNPIYANDETFIAGLMSLPFALRKALMEGSWDVTGGYFTGAFDRALNVILSEEWNPEPWHRQWISGDWGFEHWSALYRHYQDDFGVIRTGRELMIQHHDPEMLGERIIAWLVDEKGNFPKIVAFPFSHDAFASTATKTFGASANSVAMRLGGALRPYGIPLPLNSGKDKLGREQTMYNLLRKEIWGGEKVDGQKRMVRNWLICEDCPKLIDTLIAAPRDDKRPEMIAEFSGDDPLQGAGYGVYHIVGRPAALPREELVRRELAATPDPIANYLIQLREHARVEKQAQRGNWWD
jgi:hypothetical protein